MDRVAPGRRVLHLVRAARAPAELAALPPGHTVVLLGAPGAPDAERLLDLVLEHDLVVTW